MNVAAAKKLTGKEAVERARAYFDQFFGDKPVLNVLLEELDFDPYEDHWLVTIGFDAGRKTFVAQTPEMAGLAGAQQTPVRASRKFVLNEDGALVRIKDV